MLLHINVSVQELSKAAGGELPAHPTWLFIGAQMTLDLYIMSNQAFPTNFQ